MQKHYYAIEHAYGGEVRDANGDMLGHVYQFDSKAKRDAWVAEGNEYFTQPGAREPISAKIGRTYHFYGYELPGVE